MLGLLPTLCGVLVWTPIGSYKTYKFKNDSQSHFENKVELIIRIKQLVNVKKKTKKQYDIGDKSRIVSPYF